MIETQFHVEEDHVSFYKNNTSEAGSAILLVVVLFTILDPGISTPDWTMVLTTVASRVRIFICNITYILTDSLFLLYTCSVVQCNR